MMANEPDHPPERSHMNAKYSANDSGALTVLTEVADYYDKVENDGQQVDGRSLKGADMNYLGTQGEFGIS